MPECGVQKDHKDHKMAAVPALLKWRVSSSRRPDPVTCCRAAEVAASSRTGRHDPRTRRTRFQRNVSKQLRPEQRGMPVQARPGSARPGHQGLGPLTQQYHVWPDDQGPVRTLVSRTGLRVAPRAAPWEQRGLALPRTKTRVRLRASVFSFASSAFFLQIQTLGNKMSGRR